MNAKARTKTADAAVSGKKLIAQKSFNQNKFRAFIELRHESEIWVKGQFIHWRWFNGPEIEITTLAPELKQKLLNAHYFVSRQKNDVLNAIKMVWHEAAKQNDFFRGADELQLSRLIAKKRFNGGQAAAFLEMRRASEFWVYGKFYDPRGVRGPEVQIELEISENLKEEFLFRETWTEPMSEKMLEIVHLAWKQAAEKDSFFKGLTA